MSHIAYLLPTHRRPLDLINCLKTAYSLRSGHHDVKFAISCDEDDEDTQAAVQMLSDYWPDAPIQLCLRPSPDDIGSLWNEPLRHIDGADIITFMSDRLLPITLGWDEALVKSFERYPNRVLWWTSPQGHQQILPAISGELLDCWPERKPYPEIFPFWYTDVWTQEIDGYIHGLPCLHMPAYFAYDRRETKRLRDVGFWADYFAKTRHMRIDIAKSIAMNLGIKWEDRPVLTAEWERQDDHRRSTAHIFEERFGEQKEPTAGYLRIKAQAEEAMRSL